MDDRLGTEKTKEEWIKQLRQMDQIALARLYRFAPPGHRVFSEPEVNIVFNEVFKGWNPGLSKLVGWS